MAAAKQEDLKEQLKQDSAVSTSEGQKEEPKPEASTEETTFCPEICKAPDSDRYISFRFHCPSAGAFRCSYTGLIFVVTKEAELTYKVVQWDERQLQSSGRFPAGPLYDIKCPEKAMCELHLPHCEPKNADLSKSRLSVAHINDSGLFLIGPRRVSESHVVIPVSSLSSFGLVVQWHQNKLWPVSGKVLLFRTPAEPRREFVTVNMVLLPRNMPTVEVESKQFDTTELIDAPSPCLLFLFKHYHVDCPAAEIVQPERSMFEMFDDPDISPLFQLHLYAKSSTVSIILRQEGSAEESGAWRHDLSLDTDGSSSHALTHPSERLRSVWYDFVQTVPDPVLNQLQDRLLQEELMSSEEINTAKDGRRDQRARTILGTAMKKGPNASLILIEEYCKCDPQSELSKKLRPENQP